MHLPNHDGSNVKPITHHVRHDIQTLPPHLTRTAAQKTSLLQIDGFVAYADPRHMVTTYVQQYAPHSRDLEFSCPLPQNTKTSNGDIPVTSHCLVVCCTSSESGPCLHLFLFSFSKTSGRLGNVAEVERSPNRRGARVLICLVRGGRGLARTMFLPVRTSLTPEALLEFSYRAGFVPFASHLA